MNTEGLSFRLAEPSRVVQVVIARDGDELTITLRLLPLGAADTIEGRCHGAASVRFRGERTELTEIVVLMAEDISSRGWEDLRFQVMDAEEEFISFFCREIERSPPE